MATQPSRSPSCTRRGVILKCYVDGKKRFRALSIDDERPTAPPTLDRDVPPTNSQINASLSGGASGSIP